MKKLWILAMILLAVGCSKTEDGGIIPESTLSTVLYGVIEDGNEDEEDETRVYLDNKIRIRWNKSDLITVFNGTTRNQKYEYLGRDGSTGGEFDVVPSESLGAGNAVEHIYALYPYDRFTEYCYAEDDSESDYIVYTVPAEQTYKTNSIGLNSNLMVAVTPKDGDGTLVFRNVCSYLRLKFYGKDQEVRSIVLKGNAGEVLSGDAAITPVYGGIPTIKMLAEAGDDNQTITLNCPESVTVGSTKEEATEFWMVVPPFNFSQGFTITVYGDDNKSQEYIFNNNLTFERNTYNTITRELTSYNIHIPGNQIWYTSTDGKIVEPSNAKAFGANVVSNVYEDGKGVITFDKVVTGIGYGAFSEIQNFKSVTISDDVKTVNDLAIYYCHNLEAFYGKFSSDDNRCLIVDGKLTAFAPSDLVSYDIPETVTEIGNAVFKGISGLEQINIPNTVTTIHGQAFHACWDLKSVTIPESVVDIREGAFTYCRRLTAFYGKYASSDNKALIVDDVFIAFARGCSDTIYTIPDGVTAIGSGAFYGNSDIVEVVFPNSLTRIVRGAFSGCSSMKNVTIPENVTTIEENAFCGIGLESVICKPTTPPAGAEEMFKEMNSSAKIYVPAESVEAYKVADYWKDYADYIFADPDSVEEEDGNSFNENHCIYYRTNATGGWDTGYENYRRTESYITCGASGKTLEMKFKLSEFSGSSYVHLATGSNLAKDSCDELRIDNSSIELTLMKRDEEDDDDWVCEYYNSWNLADFGVSATDVITLRLSGETITINGKTLSCKNIPDMGWSYIFSSYYRERDEGEWKEYEGVPEGSELYYVKMLDADGEITYLGYPKYEYNATTGQKEYYWYSNTRDPQYANDYQNQGHYTGNF